MDRTNAACVAAAVAAMLAVAWLLSAGGGSKIKAQADVAAGAGDDGMLSIGAKLSTGIVPGKWQPHVPAGAHMGRHRMYRHPGSCSPNLTAPQQTAYDWRFTPPSEGDI